MRLKSSSEIWKQNCLQSLSRLIDTAVTMLLRANNMQEAIHVVKVSSQSGVLYDLPDNKVIILPASITL